MGVIEIPAGPSTIPTVCAPVDYVKTLTTHDNAITLGLYGFMAGIIASILFYYAYFYLGPKIAAFGVKKGWWVYRG